MEREQQGVAVLLPSVLYNQIAERLKETSFGSVNEYVSFVLEEVLKQEEYEEAAPNKKEEEEAKKRLKDLGYLD